MAEGGASTGGGGAGAAVVKEGKLFKRGEVMMLVFVDNGDVEVGVDADGRVVEADFIERQTLQGGEN